MKPKLFMKSDSVYLQHILQAIENIEEYIKGFDYESFCEDRKTIAAVIREIEIIGEASNNISDEFKKKHPEIPFRDIKDMRNRLTHEYFGVNKKIIWDTCQIDLKELKKLISPLLIL